MLFFLHGVVLGALTGGTMHFNNCSAERGGALSIGTLRQSGAERNYFTDLI